MCGFAGYVGEPVERGTLIAAREALTHRGPDSDGVWISEDTCVGLGFRRLRIIDLSPASDQPMADGDLRLVFNGEIYNFRTLRAELESKGHVFRTSGDSEVILAGYREWGDDVVAHLEGMFAFAVWDGARRRLLLARDRLGIKPLYYAEGPRRFVFASEPQALLTMRREPPTLDEVALERFLTFLWVPDPDTLFAGVHKLPPGNIAVLEEGALRVRRYWDVEMRPVPGDHAAELLDAIETAVTRQLAADVPVGVLLSGGIDSSLLCALATRATGGPVLAVATGFPPDAVRAEPGGDDLSYARLAAKEIGGLDLREIMLDGLTADLAAELAPHFADPVADPAALATYSICRAAKPDATVMLSGVGAEELFGGYPRHRAAALAEAVPLPVRRVMAPMARFVPGARPGRMGFQRRVRRFLAGLGEPEPYIAFCAHHGRASLSRLLGRPVDWEIVTGPHREHLARAEGLSPLGRALYLDLKTYLPCLNLAYVDRASMACSVEVRVPFLDERVVVAASAVPDEGKTGKAVLRRAAAGLVPREIVHRPKTGFGAPVRTWLREMSSEVVRDCLSERTVRERGWIRHEEMVTMRRRLLSGTSDEALPLWALVSLELWARRFL